MDEEISLTEEIERVQNLIETTRQQAQYLKDNVESRALSIVITKLEEAELWFTRINKK